MTLLLQHPALFGLLALAGLPVLVHLLSRTRPPEYRFSNVEFLRKVIRRTARFRRPKDWLLLILRTLALIALAAAFISPLLVSSNAALPGERTTVILLIDRSASMAAREGAGSRFETACAEAARFLDDSHPAAANLVWIDAEPDAAFPEPAPNLGFLTDLLQKAEPHPEPGALSSAFDLAVRQLAKAEGHREIIILSDFQASAWKTFQPAPPAGIKVSTHKIAGSSPSNLAVVRLLAQPAEPVAGQEVTLLANVRNFSPDPVRSQLTLDAGGARQSQAIDLPAWGEAETAFTLRPASSGPLAVTASIAPDAFPGDDARHAVLRVRDAIRVVQPQPNPAIARLVSALPWLEASDKARPGDVLVTTAPDAGTLALAQSGVTIVIHGPTAINLPPLAADTSMEASTTGGWQILPDENHPANRLFRTGDFGNPFAGKFKERLRLPSDLPGTKRIATYQDGVPAIIEIPTSGAPILFFNLPLDPAKSDWSTQGVFLPAFAEILLRTQPRTASGADQVLPGSLLTHTSDDPAQAGAVTLLGPDNKPLAITETASAGGSLWQSQLPATPGLHQWQVSAQTIDYTAVNFPESESDLRPLDTAPDFDGKSTAAPSLARQAALSRGLLLWPWLALAALLFLVSESLVHLRQSRPPSAAT